MSARSSASSSSCCTLRNLDRLVLACSSCGGSGGWEGEVRGAQASNPGARCHLSPMFLQQKCPASGLAPSTDLPSAQNPGYPLPKRNPMLPGPRPQNPAWPPLSNCDPDRCSPTPGGSCTRMLISNSRPHLCAHPMSSPPCCTCSGPFPGPVPLPPSSFQHWLALQAALAAALPSLGLAGTWIISSLWVGPGSNKLCFC